MGKKESETERENDLRAVCRRGCCRCVQERTEYVFYIRERERERHERVTAHIRVSYIIPVMF